MSKNKIRNIQSKEPLIIFGNQKTEKYLDDNKLSLKAKGLFSLIRNKMNLHDFTIVKSDLQKLYCSDGQQSFNAAWKELIDAGYLKVIKKMDQKDLLMNTIY